MITTGRIEKSSSLAGKVLIYLIYIIPRPRCILVSKKAGKRKRGVCRQQAHNSTRTAIQLRKDQGHFRVTLCLGFKTSPRAKPYVILLYENGFDLFEKGPIERTHFHKWFRTKTQRQKARKWPIEDEVMTEAVNSDDEKDFTTL